MFGWTKPVKPTHTLMLDDHQKFSFQPDGDHVHFTRTTLNMASQGWTVTTQDVWPIARARAEYRRLLRAGAVKV